MTTRAYKLRTQANRGKEAQIRALLPHWQYALTRLTRQAYREYTLQGRPIPKRRLLKPSDLGFETVLSSRQVDSVWTQAYGNLASWETHTKTAYKQVITQSSLDEFTKITLRRINSSKAWYAKNLTLPMGLTPEGELTHTRTKGQKIDWVVPEETLRLSRSIIKHVTRKKVPHPNLSRVRTMVLDGKIGRVEASQNSHDLWVRVSTLTKGKPVLIPLEYNKYAQQAVGDLNSGIMISISKSGKVTYAVTKTTPDADLRVSGESVGLDWGLVNLFTDSRGNQYGQALYSWLKERDQELLTLTKALQANGIKPSQSKRYRALNHRIREYVKNEVNRVLNTLAQQDIKELVVEVLDFRQGGLSKRLNRLLTRAGRGVVRSKLKDLTERHGITVTQVNPAYSSQTCPRCSWVGPENRKTQSRFICVKCGYSSHADVVAARNILGRSGEPMFGRYISKKKIRQHLLVRYHALGVGLPGRDKNDHVASGLTG